MEVLGESLDFQGLGVVKKDKIYFVENLLPGEKAVIEVTQDKTRFAFARVSKHLTKSPHRVMDNAPYYAALAHLSYDQQLAHQVKITKEIFKKNAHLDIHPSKVIYGKESHYKNKIILHVQKNGFLRLGTYKAKSHILEPIESHLLAHPLINEAIEKLTAIFKQHQLTDDSLKRIQIRSTDKDVLITFVTDNIWQESDYFTHLPYHLVIKENETFIKLKGDDFIELSFMGHRFKLYSDTFFQTNYDVAKQCFEVLKPHVSGTIVDAYAGAATIGILLSPYAKHVYSIEANEASYLSGVKAIEDNKIDNLTFIHGKVEETLSTLAYDTLIVDPPRAGLHPSLLALINEKRPQKMIYMSCNLKTLTRDIKALKRHYQIKEVIPVSMFPQTIETETLLILEAM